MDNDTRIGLLLGLVLIFVVSFIINALPPFAPPAGYAVSRLGPGQFVAPSEIDNSFKAVQAICSNLEMGSLSFRAPAKISLGQTVFLELSVGKDYGYINSPEEGSSEQMRTHGLPISNEMLAHLSGPGFRIEALTPESQVVGTGKETIWRWSVEPTKKGTQHVNLTLSANLHVNGSETPYVVLLHDHSVDIRTSVAQQIRTFMLKEWKWVWAAVCVPLVGWILYDKQRERKRRGGSLYLGYRKH